MAIDSSNTNHAVFLNAVQGVENQYNYLTNGASSPSCNDWTGASSAYIEEDGDGIYNDVAIQPISGDVCVAYQDESDEEMYACNSTATVPVGHLKPLIKMKQECIFIGSF